MGIFYSKDKILALEQLLFTLKTAIVEAFDDKLETYLSVSHNNGK